MVKPPLVLPAPTATAVVQPAREGKLGQVILGCSFSKGCQGRSVPIARTQVLHIDLTIKKTLKKFKSRSMPLTYNIILLAEG